MLVHHFQRLSKNSKPNRFLKIILWSLCRAKLISFEISHKIKRNLKRGGEKKDAVVINGLLVEFSSRAVCD